ncbi:uncharacterized protein BDV14DRAFT_194650 [Aspergillus stella-maris]|uniref:uncharacterized protein n=1 Tax=Aspergillus stella-maris TaxID=1810926 RepID=UPI003CCE0D1C
MSQFFHSQQSQGPSTLARFQLAKFSYTTNSVNHRGPLAWSHVFGNGNIIGIFEKYVAYPPARVSFRVLNNVETLEEICITDLITEFEGQMHSNGDTSRRPTFAVVVKLPCLAVKYPQGPGLVRRFQIKFSSDQDFYSALAILSQVNCPFSTSNTNAVRSMSRPATALPSFGQMSPSSNIRCYPSTTTETSTPRGRISLPLRSSSVTTNTSIGTPVSSMAPPHRSSSTIHSTPPAADVPFLSTPSNSANICDTSRHFNSSNTNDSISTSTHRAPFRVQPSINITPTSTDLVGGVTGGTKRPSTSMGFTGYHDIESQLPPKRELPFATQEAKRKRSTANKTDRISSKVSVRDEPSAPSSQKPKEKIVVLRTTPTTTTQPQPASIPTENRVESPNPSSHVPRNQLEQATIQSPAMTTALPNTTRNIPVDTKSEYLPTVADLAAYITSTTEARTARLEGWLCAHIIDDNFLQLCEDVEGVWQRVAFGR